MEPTTVGTGKSALKVDEISETEQAISIYPNPSTDNFQVLLPELGNGDTALITVSDMNGRIVLTEVLSAFGQINHHLASGIYIVNINSNEFNVTKKLIVK
ncbi:T9SS type A sorting domain-containing protein [Flavobacterium sp. LBUM151]